MMKIGLWINGNSIDANEYDTILNPYTEEPFAKAGLASKEDINEAIEAAQAAYPKLNQMTRGERADMLYAFVWKIREHFDELCEWMMLESGKAIDACKLEMNRVLITLRLSAEEALRDIGEVVPVDLSAKNKNHRALYARFPIGPIAAIAPFNFPINLAAHKVGPALAVGNPVVLKPAMQSPTVVLRWAHLAKEAGVPNGALNVVHCQPDVAESLIIDERIKLLSFTGSAKVGWHLKNIAGKKRVLLELGGNAAAIVHSDADIDHAAKRLALGSFFQSGQVCIGSQRIYVQNEIAEEFTEKFLNETKNLPIGDPKDEGVIVGPMIDRQSLERVIEWVNEAIEQGAKVLLKGDQQETILTPYVLGDVPNHCKASCEEIFGPVALINKYNSFDEAIQMANDTRYGLQTSVFTHDIRLIDQAFHTLEVGGVIVNDFPNFRTDNFPYGGIKDSGLGREGVRYAIQEMTENKMLVVKM